MKKLIVISMAFLLSGCLFPVATNLRGIAQTYEDFSFSRIVGEYEALQLSRHIPDEAAVFVEFGVDSCLVAEFNRGSERYTVEIFSFLTPKGALGSYFYKDLPASEPFNLGYYARKSGSKVQFVKGHYFVSVTPQGRSNIENAVGLAAGFAKRISGGSLKPDIYMILPKTKLIETSKFYFTGPRAFKTRYSAEMSQDFGVQFASYGVSAQYYVDNAIVDFFELRFSERRITIETVDSYLDSRRDRPIIRAHEPLLYNTIVESDNYETYIAESGTSMFVMLGSKPNGKGQEFFEYVLRGGR